MLVIIRRDTCPVWSGRVAFRWRGTGFGCWVAGSWCSRHNSQSTQCPSMYHLVVENEMILYYSKCTAYRNIYSHKFCHQVLFNSLLIKGTRTKHYLLGHYVRFHKDPYQTVTTSTRSELKSYLPQNEISTIARHLLSHILLSSTRDKNHIDLLRVRRRDFFC